MTGVIGTIIWKPDFIYLSPHNKHLEISIFKVIAAEFHLQLYTNIKSRSQLSPNILIREHHKIFFLEKISKVYFDVACDWVTM